ncbi:MAG TPA: acyl-CoA dehydrogenase [Acidimicrobiales bacterium]|nr:acyl-CoA dehydrogenase [Acidimicrobiales bacterium]
MGIAITESHRELQDVARSFLDRHGALQAARATLDAGDEGLPTFWPELAGVGWLGLHLPEDVGGQGAGLSELAVVLEELGRVVAPGPFLPAVVASGVVGATGSPELRPTLAGMADGTTVAGVGIDSALGRPVDGRLSGSAGPVLGAGVADVLLLRAGDDAVLVDAGADGVTVHRRPNLDPSRPAHPVTLEDVRVPPERVLTGAGRRLVRLLRTLAAAEAAGLARAATDMAAGYAKVRTAFGRVIGTFGPVKHHCANMLVAAELATAAAWDAACADGLVGEEDLAAAAAATLAIAGAFVCAKLNIQVHGGIGYTFEHDAHLYLRRAGALHAVVGVDAARADVTSLSQAGTERTSSVELPPEAEVVRDEVRSFVEEYTALPEEARLEALVSSGYYVPHWPKPWGRGAGVVEQLVIDEEFTKAPRPVFAGSGSWITLSIANFGTDEQRERYVLPSLMGTIRWCSMFSEPDAGSDAGNVKTRAMRVEGGWLVSGQKVWSSAAHYASHGLATVRTSSDGPKHKGITAMIVVMDAPGVEVRPLRDIAGGHGFNEVFFDDVFVPDDDVLGPVDDGWRVARATFGLERVSIGRVGYGGAAVLLPALAERGAEGELAGDVGDLLAEGLALRAMNLRQAERALAGAEPGAEGNVTKLVAGEQPGKIADLALRILGSRATLMDEWCGWDMGRFLTSRGLTIGGGTSEITRNQIGERLLGLPRDPLAT